jgi:hypothetical protein
MEQRDEVLNKFGIMFDAMILPKKNDVMVLEFGQDVVFWALVMGCDIIDKASLNLRIQGHRL